MRLKVFYSFLLLLMMICFAYGDDLPGEKGRTPAVEYNWFPSRQYAFVFRNWTTVPAQQLAKVLDTSVGNVEELAFSMGLPPQGNIETQWNSPKGYITVVRSNWNLLNYDQLLALLNINRKDLAWRLKEDDFLYVKLGNLKPFCAPLIYRNPDEDMKKKAARIAKRIKEIHKIAFASETPRFSFLNDFPLQVDEKEIIKNSPSIGVADSSGFKLRMVSSYCAEFGDPLMDKELGSFPEGLLFKLSKVGVNAIWLHTVLNTLVAPEGEFPGSEDAPKRIEGLRNLVRRASKFGIGVYLYMNEPRGMGQSYFSGNDG